MQIHKMTGTQTQIKIACTKKISELTYRGTSDRDRDTYNPASHHTASTRRPLDSKAEQAASQYQIYRLILIH